MAKQKTPKRGFRVGAVDGETEVDLSEHRAAAALGDHMRVSDDAVVMAAVGGASFIQVAMTMTPQQRRSVIMALQKMIELVEEMG